VCIVAEAVRVGHALNTEAVIRSMSSQSSTQQRYRSYARSYMQPAVDYFNGLLDSSLNKAVWIFNPQKVAMLKPDVSHVNALQIILFFKNEELETLKAELPSYLSKADDIAVKKILAIQPSSAAVERVFSLLNSGFGDQQENSLKDYIEMQ